MNKKIVKFAMVVLMLAGICFAAFNFLAVESEAAVYWQDLKQGWESDFGYAKITLKPIIRY